MTTSIRIIDAETVRKLAPYKDIIRWMKAAMITVSDRDVELPLRRGMPLPEGRGAIGMMPGYVGGRCNSAGVKLVSLVPPEHRKGSSHLGLMALYDADGLLPQAVLCGATITAMRTAAMSAAATDVLANTDVKRLAIFGAGEQAEAHIDALCQVRAFERITVWARSPEKAQGLVDRLSDRHQVAFDIADDISAAARRADVICTVTGASEPFLSGCDVKPGTHINLVGASFPDKREVGSDLVAKSSYFIDYLPSTLNQAGEFLRAQADGLISQDHIRGEIGKVFDGSLPGRTSSEEITIYKSLGVAAQDIVTAREVFQRAVAADCGTQAQI